MRVVAPFCRCGGFVAGDFSDGERAKKGPGRSGAASLGGNLQKTLGSVETSNASEAEAGQVAVAQRDAGRSHQRAIDRSKQTGEERGVGRKPDSGSLGHGGGPFPWSAA